MKNQYAVFLSFFFFVLALNAQGVRYGSKVVLKGKVIDAKTQQPVTFANIGFVGKGIGTVSDGDGNYLLEYAPATLEAVDRLQFSVIGYKTRVFSKNETLLGVGKPFNISLTPEPYSLDELVLGETKRRKSTIGNLEYDERIVGYWKDIEGLGGEILTKVKVRRKNTKLHNLKFKVLENGSDSLLVRLNVYAIDRGLVGRNLLKKSIKYTIDTKKGMVNIPLEEYGIYVHQNIIVGIELLKVYGRQIGFSLAGSSAKGISFVRYRSQDYYSPIENTSMAFELDISVPDKRKNGEDKREQPEKITLYWDASAKANNRDVSKELELLKSYLGEIRKAEVSVVKFAAGYLETNAFSISRGKSDLLIEYLENTQYAGVPLFEQLPRPVAEEKSIAIIVTNGDTVLSSLRPDFGIPTFTITTNRGADFDTLEDVALYSDGAFIPAFAISIKDGLKRLENFIENPPEINFDTQLKTASGLITYDGNALQGAVVNLKGTLSSSYTDQEGRYTLEAEVGDMLEISFPGMKSKNQIVQDKESIDVTLEADSEVLAAITVAGKKQIEEKTDVPDGKRDPNAIGYKYQTIVGEDIKSHKLTLGDILMEINGLRVVRDPYNPSVEFYVFPRTYNQPPYQPPIVVVDGMVYKQGGGVNNIPFIDPQNIKSVSASSSAIAGITYGGIANGGVIKIITKMASPTIRSKENSLLVSDNDYEEEIQAYEKPTNVFLEELQRAKNPLEAKAIFFKKYKELETPDLTFFMDSFQVFKDKDPQFAKRVITTLASIAPKNKSVMRALAFALEDLQEDNLMVRLRSHLKHISPSDIQVYRDLAVAYLDNKQYQEAFEIYKQILNNDNPEVDQKPLQQLVENELQRLIALHKSKVSYKDLPNELLTVNFNKKARIVFEWNSPKAAFEVQFVNPNQKYFTWNHDSKVTPEKIADEAQNGYGIKEFEIDESQLGDWLVNVVAAPVGGSEHDDVYLKYTLYTDYATPNETKQIKMIPLDHLTQKRTIDTITINASTYEN